MASGGPGDHPFTDLFHWGKHPFPPDIEAMVIRIRDVVPRYLDRIDAWDLVTTADPEKLDAGRKQLRVLLSEYEADLAKLLSRHGS
jgi:hypothetical protein